jgi:hypothetical protein
MALVTWLSRGSLVLQLTRYGSATPHLFVEDIERSAPLVAAVEDEAVA